MPSIAAAASAGALVRACSRRSRHLWTMAWGPEPVGVSASVRDAREPSERTTAARIRVPPRSRARTGRRDRARPRMRRREAFAF